MARARGGNTGFAVALVIFGCGFVIALLVAIILYTKIEAAEAGKIAAEGELAKYVAANERGAASEFIGPNMTTYAGMKARIDELNEALNGPLGANADLQKLRAEVAAKDAGFNDIKSVKDKLEADLASERAAYAQAMAERKAQFDQAVAEKVRLLEQISGLQQQLGDALRDADEAARERIATLSEQVGELENDKLALDRTINELQVELMQCREKLPKPPAPNTTLPDGRVASIFNDGRDLFINLGRNDGLVIGMTFEVFDPNPVIRLDAQSGEARGKATIEVYSLGPDSATARLVRIEPREQLDPGDPIVNVAYDPDMEIRMYAFGTFDIEGDGGGNDLTRIETLIKQNGAELAELKLNDNGIPILTPDLNYIVLGAEPILPEKPGPDVFDPEIIKAYNEKRAEVEAYFSIVDDAKLMRIPVLNQGRFLELIGYYTR